MTMELLMAVSLLNATGEDFISLYDSDAKGINACINADMKIHSELLDIYTCPSHICHHLNMAIYKSVFSQNSFLPCKDIYIHTGQDAHT